MGPSKASQARKKRHSIFHENEGFGVLTVFKAFAGTAACNHAPQCHSFAVGLANEVLAICIRYFDVHFGPFNFPFRARWPQRCLPDPILPIPETRTTSERRYASSSSESRRRLTKPSNSVTFSSLKSLTPKPWAIAFLYFIMSVR